MGRPLLCARRPRPSGPSQAYRPDRIGSALQGWAVRSRLTREDVM